MKKFLSLILSAAMLIMMFWASPLNASAVSHPRPSANDTYQEDISFDDIQTLIIHKEESEFGWDKDLIIYYVPIGTEDWFLLWCDGS